VELSETIRDLAARRYLLVLWISPQSLLFADPIRVVMKWGPHSIMIHSSGYCCSSLTANSKSARVMGSIMTRRR
jgi:hypothetical protein